MIAQVEELPFVDEHASTIDAPPARTWDALCAVVVASFVAWPAARLARALDCVPAERSGTNHGLAAGATVPGFEVSRFEPPRTLALEGRHRFSRYRLAFVLDPLDDGRCRVRARTSASFPGATGRAYRALVIGTRGHVVVLRLLLAATRRRAARLP